MRYYRTVNSDKDPILKLILKDNTNVDLYTEEDINYISNNQPSTYTFSLDGYTFNKSDIKHIEFTDIWNLTTIPDRFGYNFTSLETFNHFPSSITSIGDEVFQSTNMIQDIIFPENIEYVGNNFLAISNNFNGRITFNRSLYKENSFSYLLNSCAKFNNGGYSFTYPNINYTVGNYLLNSCNNFNQILTVPNGVTSIGNCFNSLKSFNQPVTLPSSLKIIGSSTFNSLDNFNSTVTFPSNTITKIGIFCFMNCKKFNKNLTITLSSSYESIDQGFLYNCDNYTSTFSCNLNFINAAKNVAASHILFSTTNASALCYTTGIKVRVTDGTASQFTSVIKNRTSSPYRKIITQ